MERLANRVMLLWGVRRVALAVVAGTVGAAALPPFNVLAAPFFSFPILVWLMDGLASHRGSGWFTRARSAFLLGWLFGFGYFVAGLWWLGNALLLEADDFAWALPFAVLGLPAFLALFYGLATSLAGILWSDGVGRHAALAFGFGLAEWLRSFLMTGFPWNAIGYGAMPMPMMMQSASVIGLFGVTTLAVFVFSVPALLGTRRGLRLGLAAGSCLLAAHLGYGAYRLANAETAPAAADLAVRLVQPVLDQSRKLENSDRAAIFEEHLALSALPPQPGSRRPDVIVWPETSVPFILTESQDALSRIAEILEDGQILIAGAVRVEYAAAGQPPRFYNSIYVIDSNGQILGASDKIHLTPFGEYVPFEEWLRKWGVNNLVALPGGFSAAANRSLLTLPSGQTLYPLICYEAIFPQEVGAEVAQADAILNITNDAWFGDTPGPYQHFQQARLRAVENGLPLLRDANSGISAVVDPYGRIVNGSAFNSKGVVDASIAGGTVPTWNGSVRKMNFWLILFAMFLIAAIARSGFKTAAN
ncbi:apolipoprotein N-acyltransferase [Pseudorhizobium tarimense]|uniref:Apolipoprotein N-acyltransferase n=1 Tax=Pseudorhizobium tarimense TaxID=1079109 RepID=A0ABV2H9P7_9HYPH|nr:apolipoprotein N-acyltransferase [Pseudorhizobium tarimense]MCJ8520425.1 apolipoprotein N-acyltransferase [Pseudorhizobium tarimense]